MDDSLLCKAFEVKEVPHDFDPLTPPSNGQEYLQHVVYEASKCPQTVVAEIDEKKIKNFSSIQSDSCFLTGEKRFILPNEWQQKQVSIFSDLRKKIELSKKSHKLKAIILPNAEDEKSWYNICYGNNKCYPSLTLLLSMNENLIQKVLEFHLEWLEKELKPNQGKWIYALLACLSLPLTCEVCSVLRDLARKCVEIRLNKEHKEESQITALNLIICLVSQYFGQKDLIYI